MGGLSRKKTKFGGFTMRRRGCLRKKKKEIFSFFLAVFVFWSLSLYSLKTMEKRDKGLDLSDQKLRKSKRKNATAYRETTLSSISPSDLSLHQEVSIINFVDPSFEKQWGLHTIKIKKAWQRHKERGSKNIVVAIIDTGVDVIHPDLRNNLWVNKGEVGLDQSGNDRSTNGIDDDKNGFIDDVHGWNFVMNDNDVHDEHGHGTHIAGIIGGEGGNGIGVSGVAQEVSLMILKYFDAEKGYNNLENTIRSIEYATRMNADIINYSGGGVLSNEREREAILEAQKKDILFVAAAGNEKSDIDQANYFPADYDLDNILSITAINKKNFVLPSSNYGAQSVDIAAPGNKIYSTLPGGRYGYMTGTSQATAFATGVAVLVLAKFPDLSSHKIIRHLTETGDLDVEHLKGKTRFRKRLNTYRALSMLDLGASASGAVVVNSNSQLQFKFQHSSEDNETFSHLTPHSKEEDLPGLIFIRQELEDHGL